MAKFEDLKGMKLPGVQADGNFHSKHPKIVQGNINPAWQQDQAIQRSNAKDLARINQQDIMRNAAQHEQNMRNPEKQKPFRMPKGQMNLFNGKLPGFFGYPGMFMQFKDYLNDQKGPTTTIDGTPLQTQLEALRNFKVS
jgi:hypothetical protein